MVASFRGFPRALDRSAIRPGRWFMAARGVRPLLCFATDVAAGAADFLALSFATTGIDHIEFAPVAIGELPAPVATMEDEIVFSPGLSGPNPLLVAPVRRLFASGSLVRLKSGDLGIGFVMGPRNELHVISLTTGERAAGFDLVFERWSLSLRRGQTEAVVGHYKPQANLTEQRRHG